MRLRTFGGLRIEGAPEGSGGSAVQRRPLALLLLLAGAGEAGSSRDKLAGFLWGESDRERSRSALRQLVYAIRRDLRRPDVIVGTADLRLNDAVLPSDLAEFDRAYAMHDDERLVSLYTAPLADGFFLNGAPEFERWLHTAQQERAQQFAEAVRRLARDAEQRGDKQAVVECWRKLAVADPLSTDVTLRYAQALADAGDRAGALKHARAHEALVREEFGVAPDPELLRFTERLRTPPRAQEIIVPREPSYSPTFDLPPIAEPRPATAAPPAVSALATSGDSSDEPHGARWRLISLCIVLVVLALLGAVGSRVFRAHAARQTDPRLLAVVPFQTLDSSLALWNEGVADLLAQTLDGRDGIHAVPPSVSIREWSGHSDAESARDLARRTGAGTVVYGFIVRAGDDSVKVVTSLLHVPENQTVTMEHRASLARVDRLIDSLTVAVARETRRWHARDSLALAGPKGT